jgi:hypothetical protein
MKSHGKQPKTSETGIRTYREAEEQNRKYLVQEAQWHIPVILATWEIEVSRIAVLSSDQAKSYETLSHQKSQV